MILTKRLPVSCFILLSFLAAITAGHFGAAPASVSASSPGQANPRARLGIHRWHRAGWQGQGVKIAVLDSGFRGYRDHLGKELPERVQVRTFRGDGNFEARDSRHGVLCAEVLHALAPAAELLFANWDADDPESFLQAVRWARQQGARILTCSLIMPSWSDGNGGGAIHRELGQLLDDDMLFFACAGNTARRHWCGTWAVDGEGNHHWEKDRTGNEVTPWGSERVQVELYGARLPRCRLEVWQGSRLVGEARWQPRDNATWSKASVRFDPKPGAGYQARLRSLSAWAENIDEPFHVVVLAGSLDVHVAQGSIPFPGDGERILTVGAVDEEGQRLYYSSCGPNSRRPKPDLVAPVPFPSQIRARPFSGTSAAAPQAAAMAALWWSRHPHWPASRLANALRRHALDLGPKGHDFETGFGVIRLP